MYLFSGLDIALDFIDTVARPEFQLMKHTDLRR